MRYHFPHTEFERPLRTPATGDMGTLGTLMKERSTERSFCYFRLHHGQCHPVNLWVIALHQHPSQVEVYLQKQFPAGFLAAIHFAEHHADVKIRIRSLHLAMRMNSVCRATSQLF